MSHLAATTGTFQIVLYFDDKVLDSEKKKKEKPGSGIKLHLINALDSGHNKAGSPDHQCLSRALARSNISRLTVQLLG